DEDFSYAGPSFRITPPAGGALPNSSDWARRWNPRLRDRLRHRMKRNTIAIDNTPTTPTAMSTIAKSREFSFLGPSKTPVWVGVEVEVDAVVITDLATSAVPTSMGDTLIVAAFPVVPTPTGAPPALLSNMSWLYDTEPVAVGIVNVGVTNTVVISDLDKLGQKEGKGRIYQVFMLQPQAADFASQQERREGGRENEFDHQSEWSSISCNGASCLAKQQPVRVSGALSSTGLFPVWVVRTTLQIK
ncbi:unnamed protein product, partial [Rhizoctonia solani]